ncbi:MAG: hypothetical protein ACRD6N_08985 [Pyrinomonadaceae bacterium]
MEGVTHLLRNGGMLAAYPESPEPKEISPRRRGVRQGGVLLLTGALLVPILGVLNSFSGAMFMDILVAVAAIVCFLGGPLRMIFAALFEEGAPPRYMPIASAIGPYAPPTPPAHPAVMPVRGAGALPPAAANPVRGWKPRPNTAELAQPPSVTENTTRLLDKDETRER